MCSKRAYPLWLTDFRITYGNKYSKIIPEGVSVTREGIDQYTQEMFRQLCERGYYVDPCKETFSEGCAYIYLRESDKHIEIPRFRVYVHPNEMAGWASNPQIKRLLSIAKENSFTTNVDLTYSRKVYVISDEQYYDISEDAKPQIIEWIKAYKKHYGRKSGTAPEAFDRAFGIKRLSNRNYSYHDNVARSYIEKLIRSDIRK